MKRKSILFLLLFLFALAIPVNAIASDTGDKVNIQDQTKEIIGEGAILYSYLLSDQQNSQPVKLFLLKLDLQNPYLEIKILLGADGTLEERATVSQMITAQKNAVAALNGGFFVLANGRPIGTLIREGELIASPNMRRDMPVFALTQDLIPVFDFFQFTGEVKTSRGQSHPLFGINKPAYNLEDGSLSDHNHLTLYNRHWGKKPRGADPNYPEAMVARVEDNLVKEVIAAKDAQFEIPEKGYVLWGAGTAADFIRALSPGTKLSVTYKTTPDYQKIKLSTGSNSFLVKNGQVARFEEELRGKTARTAVGFADDGKTLFFAIVEKSPSSQGMEQRDLAKFLVDLGLQEALNLDGGGSTTFVARYAGDLALSLINTPKEGQERKIPDAIGIFNTAPAGKPKGLLLTGPDTAVADIPVKYEIKGYDSHYHPWRPKDSQWFFPEGTKVIEENLYNKVLCFADQGPGEVFLRIDAQGLEASKKISVIRPEDIRALQVNPAKITAQRGQTIPLSFQLVTKDDRLIPLEGKYVSCRTTLGEIKEDRFEAGPQRGRGEILVSFKGSTAVIPVQIDCLFQDSAQSWAFEQIEDLAAAGIAKGFEDGSFRPAQFVTRAEMAAFLGRVFKWPVADKQTHFQDEIPAWAKDVISAGVAQNIIKGYPDGTFRAGEYVTRAELCALLDRALELEPAKQKIGFRDTAAVPGWAAQPVERAVAAGLIGGYEDHTLRPKAYVSRAEMAAVFWRILNSRN